MKKLNTINRNFFLFFILVSDGIRLSFLTFHGLSANVNCSVLVMYGNVMFFNTKTTTISFAIKCRPLLIILCFILKTAVIAK